jgi:kynurenine formamidase
MKLVDLTHTFTIHTPGWVGYPSPTLSYFQRHATNGIFSQKMDLPLHSGTHFDAEMHIVSGGKDLASVPLDKLCREGVIVDISADMGDWTVIKPEHITSRIEVKRGTSSCTTRVGSASTTAARRRTRSGTSSATPAVTASSPNGSSTWNWPGPASTPAPAITR